MSRPPEIRRGGSADLPAVSALLEVAGLPTADLRTADLQTWLVESENALVGVIALERFGPEALLRSLAVVPEYRKLGIGRRLVARLEEGARASGVKQLVLLTETAESFFRGLGYSVIDRTSLGEAPRQSAEFLSLCPVSAVCMGKTLAGALRTPKPPGRAAPAPRERARRARSPSRRS